MGKKGLTEKQKKCSDNGLRIKRAREPETPVAAPCCANIANILHTKPRQYSAHCTLGNWAKGGQSGGLALMHGELRSGGQNLQSRRRHFYDYFTGSKRANFAWHDRKNI